MEIRIRRDQKYAQGLVKISQARMTDSKRLEGRTFVAPEPDRIRNAADYIVVIFVFFDPQPQAAIGGSYQRELHTHQCDTPYDCFAFQKKRARGKVNIRNARHLEAFRHIRQVIFDKTGTLTTGEFSIGDWRSLSESPEAFRQIVYSLEKYSNHPIAEHVW